MGDAAQADTFINYEGDVSSKFLAQSSQLAVLPSSLSVMFPVDFWHNHPSLLLSLLKPPPSLLPPLLSHTHQPLSHPPFQSLLPQFLTSSTVVVLCKEKELGSRQLNWQGISW